MRLFIASSNEVVEIRDNLTLAITSKNKILKSRSIGIEVDRWEFESGTMPGTGRSQDAYNDLVSKADLVVIIIKNKVGQYTKEEFQVACDLKQEADKPEIVVYQLSTDRPESSLTEFIDYLHSGNRDYYPVNVENADALWNQLSAEIDRLANALDTNSEEHYFMGRQTELDKLHEGPHSINKRKKSVAFAGAIVLLCVLFALFFGDKILPFEPSETINNPRSANVEFPLDIEDALVTPDSIDNDAIQHMPLNTEDSSVTSDSIDDNTIQDKPFSFNGRKLESTRFVPSASMFEGVQYWDSSYVRFLDFEYIYPAPEPVSGLMKVKYAYICKVHCKSSDSPEVELETLPVSTTYFNALAGFMLPINHEPTEDIPHYHYDYYFVILEDYSGNCVVDFVNVIWIVDSIGNDRNRYDVLTIYDEQWDKQAYTKQNKFADDFMTNYCVYTDGNPRSEYCQIDQQSLDGFREKAIQLYSELEDKVSCEEVGSGAVAVTIE
jgi:hypothetical protein